MSTVPPAGGPQPPDPAPDAVLPPPALGETWVPGTPATPGPPSVGGPTSAPRRQASGPRIRLVLALVIGVVIVALVVVVVQVSQTGRRHTPTAFESGAREYARTLMEGFTRGDPAALDAIMKEPATPRTLLTPEAARVAFGDKPTIELVVPEEQRSDYSLTVLANITTPTGIVPVLLWVSREVDRGQESFRVAGLNLPRLWSGTSGAVEPGAAFSVNGVALPPAQLESRPAVFPGRLVIQAPAGRVLRYGTGPGSTLLDVSLLQLVGSIDHPGVSVEIPFDAGYSPEFLASAREAVLEWTKKCTGTREKMPSDCFARADKPSPPVYDAKVREERWSVDPSGTGASSDWLPFESTAAQSPDRIPVSAFPLSLRGTAQWLDGDTWRHMEFSHSTRLYGELRRTGDRWTFTPTPRREIP